MKIRILGCSGVGKTYAACRLSTRLNCRYFELDHIQFDMRGCESITRRTDEVRDKLLHHALSYDSWVIEGNHFGDWCFATVNDADLLIVMNSHRYIRAYRIIGRFIKRKLGLIHDIRADIRHLVKMLRYNHDFDRKYSVIMMEKLSGHSDKLFFCNNYDDVCRAVGKYVPSLNN